MAVCSARIRHHVDSMLEETSPAHPVSSLKHNFCNTRERERERDVARETPLLTYVPIPPHLLAAQKKPQQNLRLRQSRQPGFPLKRVCTQRRIEQIAPPEIPRGLCSGSDRVMLAVAGRSRLDATHKTMPKRVCLAYCVSQMCEGAIVATLGEAHGYWREEYRCPVIIVAWTHVVVVLASWHAWMVSHICRDVSPPW